MLHGIFYTLALTPPREEGMENKSRVSPVFTGVTSFSSNTQGRDVYKFHLENTPFLDINFKSRFKKRLYKFPKVLSN